MWSRCASARAKAFPAGLPRALVLGVLPDVVISDVQTVGANLILDLTWVPEIPFQSSSSTITDVNEVVSGWNLYKIEVASGNAARVYRI